MNIKVYFPMNIDKIIYLIGGNKRLSELLNVSKSAISNYKKRGGLPSYALPIIINELKFRGIDIDFQKLTGKENFQTNKTIVFIVTGGISAYKAPEIIRRLRDLKYRVIPVITYGATKFITQLTLSAVAEEKCYSDIFNLSDESEMGHIKLARCADIILVAPASANFISKIASGMSNDLSTTLILASKAPVYVCPAMNPSMWINPVTQENVKKLKNRLFNFIGPEEGISACGEFGFSRLSESRKIIDFIEQSLIKKKNKILKNLKVLITAGPTIEPIDEVRYLSNWSSGKQGYNIAEEFAKFGAKVTLVSGPVNIDEPEDVNVIRVKTAEEMLNSCTERLPVDVAIFVAAVSDWKVNQYFPGKIKKNNKTMSISLLQNQDILKIVSSHKKRPNLVIGFSAETNNLENNTKTKLKLKGCDWMLGNKVGDNTDTFGGDYNNIIFVSNSQLEKWPVLSKMEVANKLAIKVNNFFRNDNAKNKI